MKKTLYIIAGCNGAGKTTASFTILPEILDCKEFVNADEIAKGLSPFQPERVSIEAGRIMLGRIQDLMINHVTLLFFWLQSVELAIERVRIRVQEGGHHIEPEVIKRRYSKGIHNLFTMYLPIVDDILIFDNSFGKHELIAKKAIESEMDVFDPEKFQQLTAQFHESQKSHS